MTGSVRSGRAVGAVDRRPERVAGQGEASSPRVRAGSASRTRQRAGRIGGSNVARSVLVIGDSYGEFLVALTGEEADRLWWPTWLISDGKLDGPRCLGNYVRFIPSD